MFDLQAFLNSIEEFRTRTGMSESAFGKQSVGDPNLLSDIRRKDRMPSVRLIMRVASFIENYKPPADEAAA